MTDKDEQHKPSLVERHAMGKLDKVQEEKQRPYKKHKSDFHFSSIIMGLVFLIVLVTMLIGIIK
ncbi:hypothetical protein [Limosilactobacillus sp.]|uniref:hypothetical protein n=1 Tax=Limosilactobacillus sp. TaxID=2773925 RepID=UPI00345E8048